MGQLNWQQRFFKRSELCQREGGLFGRVCGSRGVAIARLSVFVTEWHVRGPFARAPASNDPARRPAARKGLYLPPPPSPAPKRPPPPLRGNWRGQPLVTPFSHPNDIDGDEERRPVPVQHNPSDALLEGPSGCPGPRSQWGIPGRRRKPCVHRRQPTLALGDPNRESCLFGGGRGSSRAIWSGGGHPWYRASQTNARRRNPWRTPGPGQLRSGDLKVPLSKEGIVQSTQGCPVRHRT